MSDNSNADQHVLQAAPPLQNAVNAEKDDWVEKYQPFGMMTKLAGSLHQAYASGNACGVVVNFHTGIQPKLWHMWL